MADPLNVEGFGDQNDTSPVSDEPPKFKDPLICNASNVESDDAELESLDLDTSAHSDANVSRSSSLIAAFKLDDDTDMETRDLFVVVDNPEKHNSTMDSYITFRCTTRTTRSEYDTHEYCVRRRYNDFLWLRQKLEEAHPTHLVPPLPEKHSLKRLDRFSPEFIRVRQRALQKFLTRIADHPVLSFNNHFQVFLTTKAAEFAAHKKQGSGLISRVADSIHNMSAAYMMKNRHPDFVIMQDYIMAFSDKLGVLERISQRIVKEQTDYLLDLYSWGPVYTLWSNSEKKLAPALLSMSNTLEKCSQALKDLVDASDDSLTQPLKEYVLYTEAVKTVLRRRDVIQMEYDMTVEELNKKKEERETVKVSDQTYSFGAFLGKDPEDVKLEKQEKLEQQIQDLMNQMESLNDKTVIANADLKADMERWHKNKKRDMKELFSATCDRQIKYYETCLRAWENAIRSLQAQEPAQTEKLEAQDSGHGSID